MILNVALQLHEAPELLSIELQLLDEHRIGSLDANGSPAGQVLDPWRRAMKRDPFATQARVNAEMKGYWLAETACDPVDSCACILQPQRWPYLSRGEFQKLLFGHLGHVQDWLGDPCFSHRDRFCDPYAGDASNLAEVCKNWPDDRIA